MENKKNCFWLSLVTLVVFLSFFGIYACSGSGGGGSTSSESILESSTDQSVGSVGILMADYSKISDKESAPETIDQTYEHIWITVTKITLLPVECSDDDCDSNNDCNGAKEQSGDECKGIVVFESDGYKLDLMALDDEEFLLTLNDNIPVGTYWKIRVAYSSIEVEGGVCDGKPIQPTKNGNIELKPEACFTVNAGDTVYVKINYVKMHLAGKSGKCVLNPEISVIIIKGEPIEPVCFWSQEYPGTITALVDADLDGIADRFVMERDVASLGTLEVKLTQDTVIFDEQGVFIGPEGLALGQTVSVRGILNPDGTLTARTIVFGNTIAISGTIVDAVHVEPYGDNHSFLLMPDAGEAIVGPLKVVVYDKTLLFTGCDTGLTINDYLLEKNVIVIGKLFMNELEFRSVGIKLLP